MSFVKKHASGKISSSFFCKFLVGGWGGSLSYNLFFFSEFNKFIDYDHVLIDSQSLHLLFFLMSHLNVNIIFSLFNLFIHFLF